ncbi:MAG: autotransporter domain-containing protein [Methylococcales symbiont of Hymedesmia sp. n. MRB-2018]|nr:MAG: autotransporter domain-containing protein [Methylococcales symbiont of Hymedesmia sp. n. MRB-2018]
MPTTIITPARLIAATLLLLSGFLFSAGTQAAPPVLNISTTNISNFFTTEDGLAVITIGSQFNFGGSNDADGGTITIPRALDDTTITVILAALAVDSTTLPANPPAKTVADIRRSLVEIELASTDVNIMDNPVKICLPHHGIDNPGLYHAVSGEWAELPSQRVEDDLVCGETGSFSPFAVFGNIDVSLTALTLSAGALDPAFDSDETDYTANVIDTVTSLTVTATTSIDSTASVTVNGNPVNSGEASADIDLDVGANTITIVVTAADGITTEDYTIIVTRAAVDPVIATATVDEAQILNAILPQLLRATTKITRDNISNRIDQAFASSPEDTDASLNLGGSSNLQELINNNARTALQDGLNVKQMLNNTSFLIPLNVAGDNNYGINNMTLWGSGDYLNLADDVSAVDWEGEVIGGSVGIDARLNQNLVAGAALSYSEGDVDYKRKGAYSDNNSLTNTLYSIHPYIAYDLSQGRVWGTLGYGQGEVEVSEQGASSTETSNRDTELYSLAFGGSGDLLSSDNWLNIPGTTTLRLKGEVSLSNIKVDKSNLTNAKALSIDAHRYRMALESSHKHTLASGASISPSIELGIRYDDGSGETGGGIELAGSYRYSSPIGLEMELRAHGLLVHESNYKEWGLSGLVKYQANSSGQGLWLSLQPAWGDTPGNVADGVWSTTVPNNVNDTNDEDNSSNRRLQLNTELGYGLPGFFGRGLLTPYAGLGIANGTQSYNIGGRWAIDSTLNLSLIGEHKQTEDSIELRGDLKF